MKLLLLGALFVSSLAPAQPKPFVRVEDGQITVRNQPHFIWGLNYYPKEGLWEDFWTKYDRHTIEQDLANISGLGFNTVRIFLNYWTFKDPRHRNRHIDNLRHFLDNAEAANLKVIVTLFDWALLYDSRERESSKQWLHQIVNPFKDHPNILAWDVKNEPDHDLKDHGGENVFTWLEEMTTEIRLLAPNHLITIGWHSLSPEQNINYKTDFLSMHYYRDIGRARADFEAMGLWFPMHPMILGETGLPTTAGVTEGDQAYYIAEILASASSAKLSGVLLWAYIDQSASMGRKRPDSENHFGLYDLLGEPKLVAQQIKHGYVLGEKRENWLLNYFWRKNYTICIPCTKEFWLKIDLPDGRWRHRSATGAVVCRRFKGPLPWNSGKRVVEINGSCGGRSLDQSISLSNLLPSP